MLNLVIASWSFSWLLLVIWSEELHTFSAQTIAGQVCENGALFTLFNGELAFEDANTFCSNNDLGTLARISSNEEFELVSQLKTSANVDESFWIGTPF